MNWGFIGTGTIADWIMSAFRTLPTEKVVSAYDRDGRALEAFCRKWEVPGVFADLDQMLADPGIDIIYVATPHLVHCEHTLRALQAGKHVLCEKPMAMSQAQLWQMADAAKMHNLFLMEAMWSRFLPLYRWLKDFISRGSLGRLYNVMADFSYHHPYDSNSRIFRRDLGGGVTRGAGLYPLSIASMAFAAVPTRIKAEGVVQNGVDIQSASLLGFPGGGMAELYVGFQGMSVASVNLAFERGSIWIPDMIAPDTAFIRQDGESKKITRPFEKPGYQYELKEVISRIRNGERQSPVMPLAESIALSGVLDEICRQIFQESYAHDLSERKQL